MNRLPPSRPHGAHPARGRPPWAWRGAGPPVGRKLKTEGLVVSSPSHAGGRVGVRGKPIRTAYQDFFAVWKDADPDIPIRKQAKAEYQTLQQQKSASN